MKHAQMTKLKVVMAVANNDYPADARVRREALTLVNAGYSVIVIAPQGESQVLYEVLDAVQVLRYPAPAQGTGVIFYALEFAYVTFMTTLLVLGVWLRQGMDVLHIHNPPDTLFIAGLLPKLFGKVLIYDHHDLAPELYLTKFQKEGDFIHHILLLLENLSCRLADYIIEVNESYKQNDINRNHLKANHSVIVRNAPSLNRLKQVEKDEGLAERAGTIAGYLGHIAKQDGVDHMLRALHYAETEHGFKDWYAIIIGTGDEIPSLQALAQQLGIAEKICFTGYLKNAEWRRMLNSADVCFVPDPSNPLNEKSTMTKMMDYMALGKAIVAYDLSENRVSAGEAALYAINSDYKKLAEQFLRLAEDESLRERLGAIGKQRIREHLAWEYSANRLLELYERISPQTNEILSKELEA